MLARALVANARDAGCDVVMTDAGVRRWASATFTGERIAMTLHRHGGPVEAWLATLPDAELAVRGCLLADLTVKVERREIRLEALLLRDG